MKKELIYELVKNAYGEKDDFNRFLTSFIERLKDEGYFEMAKAIQNIQYNNTKIIPAQKKSTTFETYSSSISKEMHLIKKGYDLGIIKSVILYGQPGTGKTFFVDKLSSFLGIELHKLSLSEIMDYRYGETIRHFEVFLKSHIDQKCIIFIDEAESLFSLRGKKNDVFESDRLLTTALQLFDLKRNALLVLATNLFNNLDPAITRRFDLLIDFDEFEIDVKKLFRANMDRWPLKIERKEITEISQIISKNLLKPKFSDIDFLSRKFSMNRIAGEDFSIAKSEVEKSIRELNQNRKV